MQACGQQKLYGSSFAGDYISGIPARFHSGRLALIRPKSCVGEVLMPRCLYDYVKCSYLADKGKVSSSSSPLPNIMQFFILLKSKTNERSASNDQKD
jgi:hypothetical protein